MRRRGGRVGDGGGGAEGSDVRSGEVRSGGSWVDTGLGVGSGCRRVK